jgi:exodeoxyribonuclease VII large subunit
MTGRTQEATGRVERAAALLALLSPERTLARGYAIVRDADDGAVIASASGIGPGRRLDIGLRDGRIAARTEAER